MPERHGEGGGSSQLDALTGVVVPTCFWEGCDEPAPLVHELILRPADKKAWRAPLKIPLCRRHWRQMRDTGHLRLYTHPDNLLGM